MSKEHFEVGDKVSWDVGSDVYTGVVEVAGPMRVVVSRQTYQRASTFVFTRRKDGLFLMRGQTYSTLRHGGEEYRDPDF